MVIGHAKEPSIVARIRKVVASQPPAVQVAIFETLGRLDRHPHDLSHRVAIVDHCVDVHVFSRRLRGLHATVAVAFDEDGKPVAVRLVNLAKSKPTPKSAGAQAARALGLVNASISLS